MTNDDVIKMAQAKIGDAVIIGQIRSSTCKFDISIEALVKLKAAGVSDTVLQAMQEAAKPTIYPPMPPGWPQQKTQTGKKVDEPEKVLALYYLDPATAKLDLLEKQIAAQETHTSHLGYGGSRSSHQFPGERSPLRIKAGQKQEFVIRMSDPGPVERSFIAQLTRVETLEVQKGNRVAVGAEYGGVFSKHKLKTATTILVDAEPYGDTSLKIKPRELLAPGEYAMPTYSGPATHSQLGGNIEQTYYCFGVDPPDIK